MARSAQIAPNISGRLHAWSRGVLVGLMLTLAVRAPALQPPEFWQALADATRIDRLYDDVEFLSGTLRTRDYRTPQMGYANDYVNSESALGARGHPA